MDLGKPMSQVKVFKDHGLGKAHVPKSKFLKIMDLGKPMSLKASFQELFFTNLKNYLQIGS
jgi:hypothetical protein